MAFGPSAAPSLRHAVLGGTRRALRGAGRLARPLLHRPRSRGQALVEFALIIPILFVLIMGLIEFAVAFNAVLGIQKASQDSAHTASIAGNMEGADCLILQDVESVLQPPLDRTHVRTVEIQRTALAGNVIYARNSFTRGGSMSCTLNNGTTLTVPYTRTENGYPTNQRCNVLSGCNTLTPVRSTVDNVGVAITYRYDWVTPLGTLLPFIGGERDTTRGWTFTKRNVFRMEPQL